MGKAPKLLTILVHPSLEWTQGVQELKAKGHWISTTLEHPEVSAPTIWDFDLVLGPQCWRMDSVLIKYLPEAVKQTRTIRYPPKEKRHE